MNITATLSEIKSLSIEDRILLVQEIWDSIAAEQAYPDLTPTQKQELDRRIDTLHEEIDIGTAQIQAGETTDGEIVFEQLQSRLRNEFDLQE
ncbi:MAG: addiction module protein [Spirulina sp. SIO3F2]|nr:addiction module protein [Spirulina sp. SIO3F2]